MKKITIISETEKALKCEFSDVIFWIQKRWMREDGSLTRQGLAAYQKARKTGSSNGNAKPFLKCKYAKIIEISEKCIKAICYNGQSDILPTSQIRFGLDHILIPAWLAEKKNLQVAEKVIWIEA